MTFTPYGKHWIAGNSIGTDQTFLSEPAHGAAHVVSIASVNLVNSA